MLSQPDDLRAAVHRVRRRQPGVVSACGWTDWDEAIPYHPDGARRAFCVAVIASGTASLGNSGLIFLPTTPVPTPVLLADDEHLWHHDGHSGGGAQEPQHQDVAGPHRSLGPDLQHR